jgi:hypothetical protein
MNDQSLIEYVANQWQTHYGTVCRGINWIGRKDDSRDLQVVAAAIGGPALARICRLMCLQHKHFLGGLPDLILWRVVHPKDASCQ